MMNDVRREARIAELHRQRPRDRVLRAALALLGAALVGAWVFGPFSFAELLSPRRQRNFEIFLEDMRPRPLRGRDWDFEVFWRWVGDIMQEQGFVALRGTLSLSLVATVLAGLVAIICAPLAARSLIAAEPFLSGGAPPTRWRRAFWRALVEAQRLTASLMRALPEYLLAFLFAAFLPSAAWPAVIALAIHNGGILTRLVSENIENLPGRDLAHLRALGASRAQIAAAAVAPGTRGRFLVYLSYRWESCVREATVLGMLGFGSIGFAIVDARTRGRYDELIFFVLLGAAIVMVGDLLSSALRRHLR
jgi:phosphonate transport system permease protein